MSKLLSMLRSTRYASSWLQGYSDALPSLQKLPSVFQTPLSRHLSASTTAKPPGETSKETVTEDPFTHATGLERAELEAKAKGINILEEEWLSAPFGTIDKPAVVPSIYEERIVGVPDPEDDCIITWGIIREGEPPRQIVEGGEYFVLKRVPAPDWAPDS